MKNFVWALVVLIVLGAGYLLLQGNAGTTTDMGTKMETPVPGSNTPEMNVGDEATTSGDSSTAAPMTATVMYNGDSFSPAEVTVKKGGTVTWVNSGGTKMWIASAQHPTHIIYAGTSREEHCPDTSGDSFDQCAGETGDYSFIFSKVGTWNYHDHINAQLFGKVIVVE